MKLHRFFRRDHHTIVHAETTDPSDDDDATIVSTTTVTDTSVNIVSYETDNYSSSIVEIQQVEESSFFFNLCLPLPQPLSHTGNCE